MRAALTAVVVAGGLVFAVLIGLRTVGALEGLELAVYDWHIRLRPGAPARRPPVVLVTISDRDMAQFGTWPVPDGLLAKGLETLSRSGARAIGLDIYRDVPVPPGNEALNALLAKDAQIIGAMLLPRGENPGVRPPAVLAGTERTGFTDIVVDADGRVRRGLLMTDDGKNVFYSMPLRLALLYLQAEGVGLQGDPQNPEYLRLGRATLRPFEANDGGYVGADAGGYQFLLDYRDGAEAFGEIGFSQLLAGEFDRRLVKDRVVLVGVASESVKDNFYTPFSGTFRAKDSMYGAELHGHMVSQLVRAALAGEGPVAVLSDSVEALWILLWCLLGAALVYASRSTRRFALAAVAGLLVLAGLAQALFVLGWWIPLVPPALGWVAAAGVVSAYVSGTEKKERARLMGLFSSYVSAELAEAIWRDRTLFLDNGRPKPQRVTATVFFSDVSGFTTISETLDPVLLMEWLYGFMEAITPIVGAHGGVILRFIGDSIMAVFGVPVPRTTEEEISRDAVNAVECALAMQARLIVLNKSLEQRGLPLIAMRIGILTGPMVAGSLGTANRMEYNCHGDTVNTGARLESFGREEFTADYLHAPCRILVGEPTLRRLGERFQTEYLGEFQLKGKLKPLRIHRVHGRAGMAEAAPEVNSAHARSEARR
ncbi:MAG TPA: adenylate/guanylate cyclase domain-containing protein [Burkholderiales bacterium]|nr:adenylate/guanylate cyclase domain-containing protein [Burkholderiales bacterium]